MEFTKDEHQALSRIANAGTKSPDVAPTVLEALLQKGFIERQLGSWIVTSRGHTALLRAEERAEQPR